MYDSTRATSCISQPEQVSNCRRGHSPLLSRNSEKTNLQGRVQWHRVSSVTRHVTWRVIEMQWAIGFFNKKKTFCSDCEQKPAICIR
jgi:hypothetical protein